MINVPVINVFNKCDIADGDDYSSYRFADGECVFISAKTGEGTDSLLAAIENSLPQTRKRVKFLLPFDKGSVAFRIRENGSVYYEEYTPDGILLDCETEISLIEENKDYII